MTDRSPIAALLESWKANDKELALGGAETCPVGWLYVRSAALEAAIAAQVEVWETDGLATVDRCIKDLKGPKP